MKWIKHGAGMLLSALGAALIAVLIWKGPGWVSEWRLRQEKPETPAVTVIEPSGAGNFGDFGENAENEQSAEEIEAAQREKYASILARNPDVVGWLTIEDTPVDLPVLQTTDNEFYLHHNLDGEYDDAGLPFVDYECDVKEGRHLIIYGHHMSSRFDALAEYYDPDYYTEHPVIQLDTLYESSLYKVVAVYAVTARTEDDDYFAFNTYVDFDTDEEEQEYLDEIEQRAFYTTGDYVRADEKLLSLCTCTYQMDDARLVVMARPLREGESLEAGTVTVNPDPLVSERWP